jgi:hypothetical protein
VITSTHDLQEQTASGVAIQLPDSNDARISITHGWATESDSVLTFLGGGLPTTYVQVRTGYPGSTYLRLGGLTHVAAGTEMSLRTSL